MSNTAQTLPPAPSHHHAMFYDYPLAAFLVGLGMLFFALWGITVQLTTSEAWYSGTSIAINIAPHFAVLAQPVDFFNGKMSGMQMQSFTYAWGVEVVQFLLSTGLMFALLKHNRFASWICIGCGLLIMLLDSIADYKYNNAANGWQQAGFTLVVFVMAFGVTYYALHLIIVNGIIAAIRYRRVW